MGNRIFNLQVSNNTLNLTVDLITPFFDMETSYAQLECYTGDTVTINFNITQNGLPFNLSGYSAKMNGALAAGSPLQFSEAGTITNPTLGQCSVTLTGTDTNTPGEYISQLFITQNGTTQTVFVCPIVINSSIV